MSSETVKGWNVGEHVFHKPDGEWCEAPATFMGFMRDHSMQYRCDAGHWFLIYEKEEGKK